MAYVIIDDYFKGYNINLDFTKERLELVKSNWNTSDKLLLLLKEQVFFKDIEIWSDLSFLQLEVLLMQNIIMLDDVTLEERSNMQNHIVNSCMFIIGCLLLKFQNTLDMRIDVLKLKRISYDSLLIEIQSSNQLYFENKKKLRLVVDNTKDEL